MPLTRPLALALLFLSAPASAGIISNAGRGFAEGAVEKLQPALAATLADAELRVTHAEDHIGSIANGLVRKLNVAGEERLDQLNDLLAARILQAKVDGSELADHALAGVDQLAKNRLGQAITGLDKTGQKLLKTADTLLHDRIADLGREVDGAVEKANRSLEARIAQLDEAANRRLGNVDVIASKQRIALEETAVHVAVLVGLVVFLVHVLWRLWGRYADLTDEERLAAAAGADEPWRARGTARARMFARGLGVPLVGQLALAAIAAGALFLLYDRLPFAARREAADLVATHQQALEASLGRLDFEGVRFHASQLQHLVSVDRYQAMAAKGDLVRDLLARPTLLATPAGVTETSARLAGLRRVLGADPDLLVVEAMLLWQTGGSRREEQRAASLSARALRLAPAQRFALAPLARAHVEAFLAAPFTDPDAGLGRDAERPADLRRLLAALGPERADHPLAARLGLVRLMAAVDARSSAGYATMIRAQARLRAPGARKERNDAARDVVTAWVEFDRALAGADLARDPSVLAVFRLNDTFYARAKWFVDHPDAGTIAPAVAELPLADRAALAPPRVVWARRYRALIDGPAREVLEMQEAERFTAREQIARALEQALVDGKTAQAAETSARMGLYRDGLPFARELVPEGGGEALGRALAQRGVRLL